MPKVTDGTPGGDVSWRKSSHSNPYGNCVELAKLADGLIAVRDSRDPSGPVQIYPCAAMAAFLRAAKTDGFEQSAR
jgi:hypothetical protein